MAEFAIQAGLFTALSGRGFTVYDAQPQATDGGSAASFPCVTVGTIVLAPWDVKESIGFDFIARVHTYSRSGSMKEAKGIQSTIYELLNRGSITVGGYRLIDLQRQTSTVLTEPDGTFHGVCEYRGLIEKSAI